MPIIAETDWVAVLGAVGSFFVVVIGALGTWWLRILSSRLTIAKQQADIQLKGRREEQAEDRRKRREASDEWQQVVDSLRQDREVDRELIHSFRNDLQSFQVRLAVCEKDRMILREAIEKHGISIPTIGDGA